MLEDKKMPKQRKVMKKYLNKRQKQLNNGKKTFNGLSATEWAALSSSVWNDVSSARAKKHLEHGATYPEKLCDRLISMYSKVGDTVLDPFLGTGTTVVSAIKNKRNGVGIELTDRFFKVATESIENTVHSTQITLFDGGNVLGDYKLLQGDCSEKLTEIADNTVQLTITSPPYADLIHKVVKDRTKTHKNSRFVIENNATTNLYSDDERDLGNMPMPKYISRVEIIMKELFRVTKNGGYNAWVVVVDYIFMFDLSSDRQNTYIDYTVALVNTALATEFTPLATNGRLVGRLKINKLYIIE